MRFTAPLLFALLTLPAAGQHLTYQEWLHRAMVDMRLLPRYGDREKTEAQRASDSTFMRAVLRVDSVPRSASARLIDHGTALLRQGEMGQAMMRFNQAWLVDSLNADVYWGYGAFFMELDRPAVALQWYQRGIALDSTSARLLDGMATALLAERHQVALEQPERAEDLLSAAIALLERAQRLAPDDAGLSHHLAICHLLRNDCAEALRWHQRCLSQAGCQPERGFEERLRRTCP